MRWWSAVRALRHKSRRPSGDDRERVPVPESDDSDVTRRFGSAKFADVANVAAALQKQTTSHLRVCCARAFERL